MQPYNDEAFYTEQEVSNLLEIFLNDTHLDLHDVSGVCPSCKESFGKIPVVSVKCKNCGNKYVVKKNPFQPDIKYIISKEQFHNKEVYWKNPPYEKTRKWLESGKFVNRDLWWGILIDQKLNHIANGNLGLCRNIVYQQSKFLKNEGKLAHCYGQLCEINFYDINGAQNNGLGFDKSDGFFAPVLLKEMFETARKLNYNYDTAKAKFVKSVPNMGAPISPEAAFDMATKEYGFS